VKTGEARSKKKEIQKSRGSQASREEIIIRKEKQRRKGESTQFTKSIIKTGMARV
jgi:hypothetical protein